MLMPPEVANAVKSMSLQNMPLGHIDYFELKALGKQLIQKKHCDLFFFSLKSKIWNSYVTCPPHTRKKHSYEEGEVEAREFDTSKPC